MEKHKRELIDTAQSSSSPLTRSSNVSFKLCDTMLTSFNHDDRESILIHRKGCGTEVPLLNRFRDVIGDECTSSDQRLTVHGSRHVLAYHTVETKYYPPCERDVVSHVPTCVPGAGAFWMFWRNCARAVPVASETEENVLALIVQLVTFTVNDPLNGCAKYGSVDDVEVFGSDVEELASLPELPNAPPS
eukprot:1179791-Prorocentrum_minimum.AAC.4